MQTVKAPACAVKILDLVHLQRFLVITHTHRDIYIHMWIYMCTTIIPHIFGHYIWIIFQIQLSTRDVPSSPPPSVAQAGDEPGSPVAAAQLRGLCAGDQRWPLRWHHSGGPGEGGAGGLGGSAGGAPIHGWAGDGNFYYGTEGFMGMGDCGILGLVGEIFFMMREIYFWYPGIRRAFYVEILLRYCGMSNFGIWVCHDLSRNGV